jgi:hypothetical protein
MSRISEVTVELGCYRFPLKKNPPNRLVTVDHLTYMLGVLADSLE